MATITSREMVDITPEPAPMIRERAPSFSESIGLGEDLRRAVEDRRKSRQTQSCPIRLADTSGFADPHAERPDERSLEFPTDVFSLSD